jgi:catechol 2,3-dioxygenase-like lactoylglutathione lyase family enzyme
MLQHVTLEVRPELVRESVAFWALLGFDEMASPESLRHTTWVAREGTQIHLNPQEEPEIPRVGHVAVLAGDYDAVLRALAEAGVEIEEGSQARDARRVFVREPSGHRVEVMSAPPTGPF